MSMCIGDYIGFVSIFHAFVDCYGVIICVVRPLVSLMSVFSVRRMAAKREVGLNREVRVSTQYVAAAVIVS